jgi:hypothetical protein
MTVLSQSPPIPSDTTRSAPITTSLTPTYVRNLTALWQFDARLAIALDRIPGSQMPSPELARDGNYTVKVPIQNSEFRIQSAPSPHSELRTLNSELFLHSRHRPQQEADAWAADIKCEDKYAVVISGYGLGYHVKSLFARLPEDALLIIAEPNLPLLKTALHVLDVSEMLRSGRLLFFTNLDRGYLVDRLEPRSVLFTAGGGTLFTTHPASIKIAPEFHAAFQKMITEFVAFTRTSFVTLMLNNVATCKNIANNLGRFATTPPIDTMHNAYGGKPAILVAAGPSLQKNMHLLHEIKGDKDGNGRKAVIIAVQTMLKPLLAAGIEPDFVTSLDYNTVSTRFFENLEESGSTGRVHLVAEAKANWNVLDVFTGSMSLLHNDFASKLLRETAPPRKGLKAGATVAHLSFYLAEFLGCNPIILTGQDLGFVDGLYYKPGTAIHETWGVELGRFNTLETKEWERIVRSRTILRKIPDIHGHPMYTEEQFFTYLQQFERDFSASRHKIIDATEGGAKKQHVIEMTLRKAIDEFCGKQESGSRNQESPPWKTWRCDPVVQLERTVAALEARRRSAADMIETCDATVPLLEEMIAHQSDLARMDRLFVEVDRLRTKVGADPATFEMVCHLNTIGELRRFQADLGVKTAKDDSMERQKRQLTRDTDYVKNLKIGAERLTEILNESLARLELQLAAIRESKPWPRNVAGS